ncbi:MAG: glutamine--tRNA ligase, partial [Spirochaetales bacterium]|nr:glutamine--tRNA ligase [Spirochaetales bacterium]
GGSVASGPRVKGTIHWVSAAHAIPIEARLYDHLFEAERPMEVPEGKTFLDNLSDHSLIIQNGAMAEPSLRNIGIGQTVQFERIGYFCKDPDSTENRAVFNRTVTLKDSWAKLEKKLAGPA